MFVRTHVAFYFVSLLLSDILQGESLFVLTLTVCLSCTWYMGRKLGGVYRRGRRARLSKRLRAYLSRMPLLKYPHIFAAISSIMNSAWMREGAVVYGSMCTAQGGYCSLFT